MSSGRRFPSLAALRAPTMPAAGALAAIWMLHCAGPSVRAAADMLPPGTPGRGEAIAGFALLTLAGGLVAGAALLIFGWLRARPGWDGWPPLAQWTAFLALVFGGAAAGAGLRDALGRAWLAPLFALGAAGRLAIVMAACWAVYVLMLEAVGAGRERVRRANAALSARAEELAASRAALVAADEALRREVAERLHGPVQARVIVALFHLDAAADAWARPADRDARLAAALAELEGLAADAHTSLAGLVEAPRPGLAAMLDGLVARFRPVRAVAWDAEPGLPAVRPEVVPAAGLMVMEALLNAHRHAGPGTIAVTAARLGPDQVRVTVADEGPGFVPDAAGGGLGLGGLGRVLEAAGARWRVDAAPGRGTRLELDLPVAGAERAVPGVLGQEARP